MQLCVMKLPESMLFFMCQGASRMPPLFLQIEKKTIRLDTH